MGKAAECLSEGKRARVDQAHEPPAHVKICQQHVCPAGTQRSMLGVQVAPLPFGNWAVCTSNQ